MLGIILTRKKTKSGTRGGSKRPVDLRIFGFSGLAAHFAV